MIKQKISRGGNSRRPTYISTWKRFYTLLKKIYNLSKRTTSKTRLLHPTIISYLEFISNNLNHNFINFSILPISYVINKILFVKWR